jgi:hypothetical protein
MNAHAAGRSAGMSSGLVRRSAPLGWPLWYAAWRPGPVVADPGQPVYVSVTDFRIHHPRHAPGAWRTGLRLRRSWPRLDGAIGLWLWGQPLRLRSGSVSIWRSEADLMRFLRSPVHRAIVGRYRSRMTGTSTGWTAPGLDRPAIWQQATRMLTSEQPVDRQNPRSGVGTEQAGV